VKIIGRVLILATFCAVTYLLFSDVFSYWTGFGSTRIASLDVGKLTFIRDDRIRFGGPGVHFKEVKYYKTAQGDEIVIFQTGSSAQPKVFIRGRQKIYHEGGYDAITTYEPFVAWTYVLKRGAVLFILSLLIFAVLGLALKLMGRGQTDNPVV
jgi:hypothetical protein